MSREPIAIVGMACRFPGAENLEAYWNLLADGIDATSEVPEDRPYSQMLPTQSSARDVLKSRGAFLDDVEGFDWRAFRLSPREAKYLDPQHRLVLEVAWEALEDAGMPIESVAGSRAGVYLGIMWNDYLRIQPRKTSALKGFLATGNVFAFAPGRISYMFDLKGPSLAIDGACAASLASVHTACQSLWLNEIPFALAGGVNLILAPDVNVMLSDAGVLSPSGRCRTLDAAADGFIRGEGSGLVVLKRASDVIASDRVYGFIRGSAVAHNGHNEWIMAASAEGQQTALREAYRSSGVDPASVDYVELHGTALQKGDPLEVESLGAVVGLATGRSKPCAIGSVKSNIGHLDSAAGIAGLIKVALALYKNQIPSTLNLEKVNPKVDLDQLGLKPQLKLEPLSVAGGPGVAGVTAVSMAGLNAHIVLEGPKPGMRPKRSSSGGQPLYILPLSALSVNALRGYAGVMSSMLVDDRQGETDLADICFTASALRTHHSHRVALIASTKRELSEKLVCFRDGEESDGIYSGIDSDSDEHSPAVLSKLDQTRPERQSDISFKYLDDPAVGIELLSELAFRYVSGEEIAWENLFSDPRQCVSLPPYVWQRNRLWLDNEVEDASAVLPRHEESLLTSSMGDVGMNGELDKQREEQSEKPQRRELIADVRAELSGVLELDDSESIDDDQGLFDVGLNSLSVVELARRLELKLGKEVLPADIFDYPTVTLLTQYLTQLLNQGRDQVQAALDGLPDSTDRISDRVAEIGDEEAEALLIERLRSLE